MSLRNTSLIFTDHALFHPPGLPLSVWEVTTDLNFTYEIEPSGKLIRRDRVSGTRWSTRELTGSFAIRIVPLHATTMSACLVHVLNGRVTIIESQTLSTEPLLASNWRWVLDELDIDWQAVAMTETYRGCLELIIQAELDPGYKSGDPKVDAMVGMALCRPALLGRSKPREALGLLNDHQLRAISHWQRSK